MQPQQAVYQQLDGKSDATAYSFESVTQVLQTLFGSTVNQDEYVKKLHALKLTGPTPEGFGKYRDQILLLPLTSHSTRSLAEYAV